MAIDAAAAPATGLERRTVRTTCTLCSVACPALVTVEGSRPISLAPDHAHPLGGAVCGKGRAAPDIHDHADRVNYPLRRTRPKTDPDPGWERCTWDEALELIARKLLAVHSEFGAEAVAFGRATGGATALRPAELWFSRLAHTFGSPNFVTATHVCNWARDGAAHYTFGSGSLPKPELKNSGCILLWGTSPSATNLGMAREVIDARARGARLVVVDPRRVGLANKADTVLQVRPGADGALALAMVQVLISEGRYDAAFVRAWTNAPLLVRDDTNRLLTLADLAPAEQAAATGVGPRDTTNDGGGAAAGADTSPAPGGQPATGFVALAAGTGRLVAYDVPSRQYAASADALDLHGAATVPLADGSTVRCRTVFSLLTDLVDEYRPERAAEITGVPASQIVEAVRLIANHRPVSHYVYNGVVQHTNSTQACRAIEVFYALLGDFDAAGGNVIPPPSPFGHLAAKSSLPAAADAVRLGRAARPLGPPALNGDVAAFDLFTSVLDGAPYRVRALVTLGSNMLLANADTLRGREALQQLEFFAQAELFLTPTSQFADVVLPVADFLESEALFLGAAPTIQYRPPVVNALYERRSDVQFVFALAARLGLGDQFADGEPARAYDAALAPIGLTFAEVREQPDGIAVVPPHSYAKYGDVDAAGRVAGFGTPSGKVELFSEAFAAHGFAPLPAYQEPAESPTSAPAISADYPLVLTNAKRAQYLHSQHRAVAAIRKTAAAPTAELHPETAAAYGITHGAWVWIETPRGRVRAKADVTPAIMPGVVCGNHGWWAACAELGLEPLDPFSDRGANLNLLVHADSHDPVSGATAHRSSLCRLVPVEA
jgi:anaerobic selenocysteine-containing dehydrogenase